jgi:ubiquitin
MNTAAGAAKPSNQATPCSAKRPEAEAQAEAADAGTA